MSDPLAMSPYEVVRHDLENKKIVRSRWLWLIRWKISAHHYAGWGRDKGPHGEYAGGYWARLYR